MNGNTAIRIRDRGDYYLADVQVPSEDGKIVAQASGPDGAAALDRAAAIAQQIMTDPVMSALIPPQAHAAVASAKLLAGAAQAGADVLSSIWSRLKGPGKKRLAKVLLETTHGDHRAVADVGGGTVVVGPGSGRGGSSPRGRTSGRRGGTVIRSGSGAGGGGAQPGFRWNPGPPGHWERDVPAPASSAPPGFPPGWTMDPWGNPVPPQGFDPYAAGAYGQYYQPPSYGSYGPYGGYPGMTPGYPPMPFDPWQQYYGQAGPMQPGFGYDQGWLDALMQDQAQLEQIFAQGGVF